MKDFMAKEAKDQRKVKKKTAAGRKVSEKLKSLPRQLKQNLP